MALKGRTPPIHMYANTVRYHGTLGISRGMFFVLHGASNPEVQFFPKMPPTTVSGKPTNSHMSMSKSTVVAGRACVDWYDHATELTKDHTVKKGTVNNEAVNTRFHAHLSPLICLYMLFETYPDIQHVNAYNRIAAVFI